MIVNDSILTPKNAKFECECGYNVIVPTYEERKYR
jgi:hypothetical protein